MFQIGVNNIFYDIFNHEQINKLKKSSSERKREREFNEYIKDLSNQDRDNFKEMLEECRLITYETEGISRVQNIYKLKKRHFKSPKWVS